MVKLLQSLLICFLCTSCATINYNIIHQYGSEYGDASRTILKQSISLQSKSSPAEEALLMYEKTSQFPKEANLYVALKRKELSFDLSKELIFKADNRLFKVKVQRLHSEFNRRKILNESSTTTIDSSGVQSSSSYSDESNQSWYLDKFMIHADSELLQAIEKSTTLSIRFYLGPEPVTVNYSSEKLTKLKEFILLNPLK